MGNNEVSGMNRREWLRIAGLALGAAALDGCRGVSEKSYAPRVIDYASKLDNGFQRVPRQKSYFVVLHASANGDEPSEKTLNILTSVNTNAHYFITKKGDVCKIVPDSLVAFHAGYSRWNGIESLNNISIGIEFEGNGTENYTEDQYSAFRYLYSETGGIKDRYGVSDVNVVPHSYVAYCPSEKVHEEQKLPGLHKKPHRGRRTDPGFQFDRRAAGLHDDPENDTDVMKGDILPSENQTRLVIYPDIRELAVCEDREIARYTIAIDRHGPARVPRGPFAVKSKKSSSSIPEWGNKYITVSKGDKKDLVLHGAPKRDIIDRINALAGRFLRDGNIYSEGTDGTIWIIPVIRLDIITEFPYMNSDFYITQSSEFTIALNDECFDKIYQHILVGAPVNIL